MATALESASLVMIPSGYEEGTLGSLQPLDGSGDFTFSRGSNLSATRVKQDGYIEKGYENLLLQSNSFDTTWTTSNASVTGGQAGYDGSNDAWVLEKTNSSGSILQSVSANNLTTFSVHAKAATNSWLRFNIVGRANVFINLSNGDIGQIQGTAGITATAINAGGGWYRCSFTYNTATTFQVSIIVADSDGSTSSPTGSIYIQDAQLNQGLVAYPYLETTTTSAKGGILENTPRIDYTGGGAGSLLLEPSRANSVVNSEYNFILANTIIEYNNAISPEGYQNAFKSTATSNSSFTRPANINLTAASNVSVFLKHGNNSWFNIIYAGDVNAYFNFNILTGEFGTNVGSSTSNLKAEDYGNGWWRVSAMFDYIGNGSFRVYMASSGTTGWAQGSVPIGSYFYGYGFQVEQNATYPTSYIPTYGTSQTRAGENRAIELSVLDFFSLDTLESGTFFIEAKYINSESSNRVTTFSQGGSGNNLWTNDNFQIRNTEGSDYFLVQNINDVIDNYIKIIIRKNGTTYNVFVNGTKSSTTATITNPLRWFEYIALWENKQMIKQMIEFQTALSDSACIELTTI